MEPTLPTCPPEGYTSRFACKRGVERALKRAGMANMPFEITTDKQGILFWSLVEPKAKPAKGKAKPAKAKAKPRQRSTKPGKPLPAAPLPPPPAAEVPAPVVPKLKSWRKSVKVAKAAKVPAVKGARPVGPKDAILVALALRPEGVTGTEGRKATGWSSCSAKVDLERIAGKRPYRVERVMEQWALGRMAYRLIPLERPAEVEVPKAA